MFCRPHNLPLNVHDKRNLSPGIRKSENVYEQPTKRDLAVPRFRFLFSSALN